MSVPGRAGAAAPQPRPCVPGEPGTLGRSLTVPSWPQPHAPRTPSLPQEGSGPLGHLLPAECQSPSVSPRGPSLAASPQSPPATSVRVPSTAPGRSPPGTLLGTAPGRGPALGHGGAATALLTWASPRAGARRAGVAAAQGTKLPGRHSPGWWVTVRWPPFRCSVQTPAVGQCPVQQGRLEPGQPAASWAAPASR